MSVRKLRDSWWVDFRFNGVRHRKRSPDNTRTGAAVYESTLMQRLAKGESIDGSRGVAPSFEEYARTWFETYVRANTRPATQRTREVYLRVHLVPAFGPTRLDAITATQIERYKLRRLEDGLSPKTVNETTSVLGACLRAALEDGFITRVPKIKRLKVPPSDIDFLSREECDRLLENRVDPLCADMALVALHTGLRLGELMGLHWGDLDFGQGVLTVRHNMVRGVIGAPKSNRLRFVPMTPEVRDVLRARLEGRRRDIELVFHRADGRPLTYRRAEVILSALCARTRTRHIGWHILRHTFATLLVERGVSIRAVQTLLGHSSVTMTERYAHVAPSSLHAAVEALNYGIRKFGQPVGNNCLIAPSRPLVTAGVPGQNSA